MKTWELPELATELRWIAGHTTPGPVATILRASADQLDQAVTLIHTYTCPECGEGSKLRWYEDRARDLAVIQASVNERLLEPADIVPLLTPAVEATAGALQDHDDHDWAQHPTICPDCADEHRHDQIHTARRQNPSRRRTPTNLGTRAATSYTPSRPHHHQH